LLAFLWWLALGASGTTVLYKRNPQLLEELDNLWEAHDIERWHGLLSIYAIGSVLGPMAFLVMMYDFVMTIKLVSCDAKQAALSESDFL
jgi:hypothetical protein